MRTKIADATLQKVDAVYDFIRQYRRENGGMNPSRRELADHMQTSTSVVNYYLLLLKRQNRIHWTNKARDISIPGLARITTWKCRHCSFIGFDREPCPDHGDTLVVTDFLEL
jgi:SOS-response transcriptional repressor LexA